MAMAWANHGASPADSARPPFSTRVIKFTWEPGVVKARRRRAPCDTIRREAVRSDGLNG